ncbi:MAG TPA: DUF2382 domain-containing protein [Allosphingosinicella sp.]|jgi:hypothetical protein
MSTESTATWLPAGGEAEAPPVAEATAPAQYQQDAPPLHSAEPQLVTGRARVETDGIETAHGEPAAAPQTTGRVLSEEEIAAGGFFTERVIEVAESREEAVVEKQVVVREELVLRRNSAEHVETVRDSVRHTEVEVEEYPAPADGAERQE